MEKKLSYFFLAAFFVCSCAKVDTSEGTNVAEERAFRSWMTVNYPDSVSIAHGIYVLDDIPGKGEDLSDGKYIYVHYEIRRLEDNYIAEYTSDSSAMRRHEYVSVNGYTPNDYSPDIYHFARGDVSTGILDIFNGGSSADGKRSYPKMKVGGTRTAIVPGWLTSKNNFHNTEAEYIRNVSGTNSICRITAVAQTDDVVKHQIDSIIRVGKQPRDWYSAAGPFKDTSIGWTATDSLKGHGGHLFFIRDKKREQSRGVTPTDRKIPADSVVYINYTGRLLNGKVFDTTIADTARQYGIYDASSTYKPVSVTFSNDSTALKMGSSSIIKGFSLTIWRMHPYESVRGIFTSDYGYSDTGSKPRIGVYAPLLFDIDMVDQPK